MDIEINSIYADYFSKIGIFLALVTLTSFISKYTTDAIQINENPMLQCMLAFLIVLSIIALLDKREEYLFKNIVIFFLFFLINVTSMEMIFHAEKLNTYIIVSSVIIIGLVIGNLYLPFGRNIGPVILIYLCFLLWLPAIIRAELEGIYFLTENGRGIESYYTNITKATMLVMILFIIITVLLRKKNWKFENFGYLGAIVSISIISFSNMNISMCFPIEACQMYLNWEIVLLLWIHIYMASSRL